MALSFLQLLVSAALPVLNVFIMCSIGAALAIKGLLDGRGRQTLSQLIFWVFVPSLTFTKLAGSVNLQNLAVWWILPVNMAISISVGLLVGLLFSRLLRVEPWFQRHFMCVIALGNVGNLPIVLVQSLCATKQSIFAQSLPGEGECERLGIAYIAFSMWIAGTFQYSVAFNLLKKRKQPEPPKHELRPAYPDVVLQMASPGDPQAQKARIEMSLHEPEKLKAPPTSEYSRQNGDSGAKAAGADNRGGEIIPQAAVDVNGEEHGEEDGNTGGEATPTAEQIDESRDDEDAPLVNGRHQADFQRGNAGSPGQQLEGDPQPTVHWWEDSPAGEAARRKKQKEIQRWLNGIPWGSYFNAPTIAAASGLTVGCIAGLKGLLFGDSAPLGFLTQPLNVMAGSMIPCMMLVLGSSLSKGPGSAKLERKVIIGVVIVRLFIMPAIGTGIVMSLLAAGAFRVPAGDPLFLFVLLLSHSTPTAMNLQTVATLNQNGEEEMSCLLCWQYLASLITLPLWMCLFVVLVSPYA